MAFKSIKTTTRPSTDIPFFDTFEDCENAELHTYVNENFKNNGKIVTKTHELSEDGLTRTTTVVWQDEAAFEEYKNDSYLISMWKMPRNTYCLNNNITVELDTTTI